MIPIAEIHPALVHFPIVFLLCGFALDAYLIARRRDLASRACLPNLALALLAAGAAAAALAATFGDMALDAAVAKGFPSAPIETHEELALTTLILAGVLTVIRAFAWWRGVRLTGGRAWLLFLGGAVVVAFLLTTAYHGGELVYHLGVNIEVVHPR